MKNLFLIAALMLLLATSGICQIISGKDTNSNRKISAVTESCPQNPDSLYNRPKILQQLADRLNESMPEYKVSIIGKFSVSNNQPIDFSIYDLTDLSNLTSQKKDTCINFINHHIYHVFTSDLYFLASHIIILEDGNLKVFRAINCIDRGDKLEAVIRYLYKQPLKDKEVILDRVKNYRKYGSYWKRDNYSNPLCE